MYEQRDWEALFLVNALCNNYLQRTQIETIKATKPIKVNPKKE